MNKKLKILISNDDGINAVGIKALADVFCRHHDIVVIAPDSERSAASHGLISMRGISYKSVGGFDCPAYSCAGLPADCVKLGLLHILKDSPPDLVISGINNGTNLGCDVIYSGTVSAAFEGIYMGVKSIAISACFDSDFDQYKAAALFLLDNLDRLIGLNLPPTSALSINYPATKKVLGAKIAPLAFRRYNDKYNSFDHDNGYRLEGYPLPLDKNQDGTDVFWFEKGFVTITPVQNDRNDHASIKRLKGDF